MQTINIMAKVWPIYLGEWKGQKGERFFPPTSPTGRVSKKNFLHPCKVQATWVNLAFFSRQKSHVDSVI